MKINTKIRYGLRMLLLIAQKDRVCNTMELGAEMKVSPKYLRKLAGSLEKAQLISSVQGIYGGYKLAMAPAEITVGLIMDAFGERVETSDCMRGLPCELQNTCKARPFWTELETRINDYFHSVNLLDMMDGQIPARAAH
jgi:Rrf2 family transcriptional regulator, iron-sulfur cluster assembly transcription factor